jgi:hypothetical protein
MIYSYNDIKINVFSMLDSACCSVTYLVINYTVCNIHKLHELKQLSPPKIHAPFHRLSMLLSSMSDDKCHCSVRVFRVQI